MMVWELLRNLHHRPIPMLHRLGVLLENLAQLPQVSVASASTSLKKLTGVIAQLKRELR